MIFIVFKIAYANDAPAEAVVDNKEYSGKQNQDWEKVQAQLGTIKGKLDTQEALIKTLIGEKLHLEGAARNLKMEELKKEHQKLEKLIEDYNRLNQEYQTKFPERGLKEKRIYNRMKVKTLTAYEEDLSLQGKVFKLHNKVLSQYPKSRKKINKKNESHSSPKTQEAEVNKSPDITDKLILKN